MSKPKKVSEAASGRGDVRPTRSRGLTLPEAMVQVDLDPEDNPWLAVVFLNNHFMVQKLEVMDVTKTDTGRWLCVFRVWTDLPVLTATLVDQRTVPTLHLKPVPRPEVFARTKPMDMDMLRSLVLPGPKVRAKPKPKAKHDRTPGPGARDKAKQALLAGKAFARASSGKPSKRVKTATDATEQEHVDCESGTPAGAPAPAPAPEGPVVAAPAPVSAEAEAETGTKAPVPAPAPATEEEDPNDAYADEATECAPPGFGM